MRGKFKVCEVMQRPLCGVVYRALKLKCAFCQAWVAAVHCIKNNILHFAVLLILLLLWISLRIVASGRNPSICPGPVCNFATVLNCAGLPVHNVLQLLAPLSAGNSQRPVWQPLLTLPLCLGSTPRRLLTILTPLLLTTTLDAVAALESKRKERKK